MHDWTSEGGRLPSLPQSLPTLSSILGLVNEAQGESLSNNNLNHSRQSAVTQRNNMDNSYKDRRAIRRTPPPNPSEIRALLAGAPTSVPARNLHDVVLIMATTGDRLGELRELKWSDVDVERRLFRVGQTAGVRFVPFGPKVLDALKERRRQLPDAEYILGSSPTNALRRVSMRLAPLSEVACGRRINLHSLRHFFFAQWIHLDGSISVLASIAGRTFLRYGFRSLLTQEQQIRIAATHQEQIERTIVS